MYELTVEADFSASHLLEGYDGPCGNLHGHNYRVRVTVECDRLDALGMALDLGILKRALAAALAPLDHGHLNENPAFKDISPSAENIAGYVFGKVKELLGEPAEGAKLREVRVAESEHAWITYKP
jgi:6-pyruvoyltetrahydropterin/6-carboxytetrahydropterin synthase